MNFIDRSAESLAKSIRNNYEEAGSETALKYALSLTINTLLAIIVAMVVSVIGGHSTECIIGVISFTVLRYVSGGMHMSSSLSCCILSIFLLIVISYSNYNYSNNYICIDIISILMLFKNAPHDIKDVSSINPKYYPLLKTIAILLVCSNFLIHSTVLTTSFFIVAFFTTSAAYKMRDFVERRWIK
jgi:accessory gene regulator B